MKKLKMFLIILCVVLLSCNCSNKKSVRNIYDINIETNLPFPIDKEMALNMAVNEAIFYTFAIALNTFCFDTLDFNIYPRFFEKFSDIDIIKHFSQVHVQIYNGKDTIIVYDEDELQYLIDAKNLNSGLPVIDFLTTKLRSKISEDIGDFNIAIGPPLWDGKNNLLYISCHLMYRLSNGSFRHENYFIVHEIEDISVPVGFAQILIVADWIYKSWY
jgi:hypothetical protein